MSRVEIVATICAILSFSQTQAETSAEMRLYQDLTANYSKHVRPRRDPSETVTVQVLFTLKKVESLDERAQIMTSFGWITCVWRDEFLSWDPEKYENVTKFVIDGGQIWLPELTLYNSIEQGNDLSMEVKFRVAVIPAGYVVWSPGMRWRTICTVDLFYFPFDSQLCDVVFTNWNYGIDLVDVVEFPGIPVILGNLEQNEQWEIVNTTVKSFKVEQPDITTPVVLFTLHLQRKPMYYVMNVLVPTFIISLVSVLVFLLPVEAGEKVSLSITVLLSYTVLLLIISDLSPKSGDTTPLIALYMVISLGQTCLSLLLTIWIVNIFHRFPIRPVPGCVRSLVLGCLARMVCMRQTERPEPSDRNSDTLLRHLTGYPTMFHANEPSGISPKFGRFSAEMDGKDQFPHPRRMIHAIGSTYNDREMTLPADVIQYIRVIMRKDKERSESQQMKDEWMLVARVLDRVFFWIMMAMVVVEMVCVTTLVSQVQWHV